MAYATLDDLKAVLSERDLIQLADDAGAGTLDAAALAVIQRALDDASSEIDEELANRAADLLSPSRLRQLCVDIAAYRLISRRALNAEGPYAPRRAAYEDAVEFLRRKREEAGVKESIGQGIAADVRTETRTAVFNDRDLFGL